MTLELLANWLTDNDLKVFVRIPTYCTRFLNWCSSSWPVSVRRRCSASPEPVLSESQPICCSMSPYDWNKKKTFSLVSFTPKIYEIIDHKKKTLCLLSGSYCCLLSAPWLTNWNTWWLVWHKMVHGRVTDVIDGNIRKACPLNVQVPTFS